MALADGLTWRTHDDKRYLYVDYRGRSQEAMIAIMDAAARVLRTEPIGMGAVADFRGCPVGTDFMRAAAKVNSDLLVPRQIRFAVIGTDGLKAVILKGFNKLFPHRQVAVPF